MWGGPFKIALKIGAAVAATLGTAAGIAVVVVLFGSYCLLVEAARGNL